ncbi:MAG: MBL fold metallo-hydrolase [Coriobacteriales bacterium]
MQVTTIRARNIFDSNSYLLQAEKGFILVDTGVATRRSALVAALKDAGCRPGALRLIIITHVHTDHVGNAAFLRDKYGTPIAAHGAEMGAAEHGDMFWRPRALPVAARLAKVASTLAGVVRFEPFVPDVVIGDGQNLAPYGLDATLLHMPGHSPGSICVLTSEGLCFCGDLVRNSHGKVRRNRIVESRADYEASLARLRTLPITTVYPGHGEPFRSELLQPVF